MATEDIHVVTGAFGFSGKYITKRLLESGCNVCTLTTTSQRANPFGDRVRVSPYHFNSPEKLTESLKGARVLYNTYWVRFNHRLFTYKQALNNVHTLFDCAVKAGVERVVHISITNPDFDSPFEYFRGKAKMEEALKASGLSYAILRPAVLFGREDILINNIAWMLRHFPVFGIFGDGSYKIQPIHVDDLAQIAIEQGQAANNVIVQAIGPETFTFRQLVELIREKSGVRRPIISISPAAGCVVAWIAGKIVGDVIITRDEIDGLMSGKLMVEAPPAGQTRLTDWVRENIETLGKNYASELKRRIGPADS